MSMKLPSLTDRRAASRREFVSATLAGVACLFATTAVASGRATFAAGEPGVAKQTATFKGKFKGETTTITGYEIKPGL